MEIFHDFVGLVQAAEQEGARACLATVDSADQHKASHEGIREVKSLSNAERQQRHHHVAAHEVEDDGDWLIQTATHG
jgi:hypothetical protein